MNSFGYGDPFAPFGDAASDAAAAIEAASGGANSQASKTNTSAWLKDNSPQLIEAGTSILGLIFGKKEAPPPYVAPPEESSSMIGPLVIVGSVVVVGGIAAALVASSGGKKRRRNPARRRRGRK